MLVVRCKSHAPGCGNAGWMQVPRTLSWELRNAIGMEMIMITEETVLVPFRGNQDSFFSESSAAHRVLCGDDLVSRV